MDISSPEYRERFDTIGAELIELSESGNTVDITFYNRKPILGVRVSPELNEQLRNGVVVEELHKMLADLELSNGERVNLMDIWSIIELPEGGIPEGVLAAVDIREGDEVMASSGQTLRAMVSASYHCETPEEEEYFLRRFLAALDY